MSNRAAKWSDDQEQRVRIAKTLCAECKAECERNGTVPECWGQYGNPCAKYLDEMERIDKEVTE